MSFQIDHLIFMIFTPLSHILASLFFAKPRFGKIITALIWTFYSVLLAVLPSETMTANYFISLAVHAVLFMATTVGRKQERGFLFISYACIYTISSTLLDVVNCRLNNIALRIVIVFAIMVMMQIILYRLLLPSFRKVVPYINSGWGKYYAVSVGFLMLIIVQSVFPPMSTFTDKQSVIFLLTAISFCITYFTVFNSMKSIVELSHEKRKQTHTELLLAQVQLQANEADLVRRNRHDMRHHYQMLLSYAENGEYDELLEYLKYQNAHLESSGNMRYCENETVNNILKVYHRKAAEQNIPLEIHAAAKPDLSADSPDLVAIISNILENALHGAQQSGSADPYIYMNIKHQSGRFVVSCINSCAEDLVFDEMPQWLRGIGVNSITATADKYNGSCRFSAKDKIFRSIVIMDE